MVSSRRPSSARVSAHCARAALTALLWALLPVAAAGADAPTTSPTASIRVLFSPEEDAAGAIIDAIQSAKQEVLVQAFSFTSKNISRALQRAQRRGVRVEVLIDRRQFEKGVAFVARDLLAARVAVFLDSAHDAAHNKVAIVDGQSSQALLITGSFNFSHAAQTRNAENLLLIRGDAPLIKRYRDNWLRHRAHATRLE